MGLGGLLTASVEGLRVVVFGKISQASFAVEVGASSRWDLRSLYSEFSFSLADVPKMTS